MLLGEPMDQTVWNWHPLCCWRTPQESCTSISAATSTRPHPGAETIGACQSPQWWQNTATETQRAEAEWKYWVCWRPSKPSLWVGTGTITSGLWWTRAEDSSDQAVCGVSSNFHHQSELWDKKSEDLRLASAGAHFCWGAVFHPDWCGAAAVHLSVPGKGLGLDDLCLSGITKWTLVEKGPCSYCWPPMYANQMLISV